MSERISRNRFYEELEGFLKGPEEEKTWNGIFIWNLKKIAERLTKVAGLDFEIKNISIMKLKITVKKTRNFFVVAGKYDVFVEESEFKIVSKDRRKSRYTTISFESLYNDPSLINVEKLTERIETETAHFFGDAKARCYPRNDATRKKLNDIAFYNKKEFNSCDCE